jgi:pantetheine-phosphate adenylyltransferase
MDDLNIFNNKLVYEYFTYYHPPHKVTQLGADIWYFMKFVPEYLDTPDIYHNNENHIEPMLQRISDDNLNDEDGFVMFFFAVFHDAIHEVGREDKFNVNESMLLMRELCDTDNARFKRLFKQVEGCIQATRYQFTDISCLKYIEQNAVRYDIHDIIVGDPIQLQRNQMLLFKEYQHLEFGDYITGTVEFLTKFKKKFNNTVKHNIESMITMLDSFQPKIGVFAGSFNPFHIGHLNVLQQAERVFDKVIIANGRNANKAVPDEFKVKPNLPNQFDDYDGLITDYLSSKTYNVTLVRGLRNGDDLQYEENMRSFMNEIDSVGVSYFLCDKEFTHISSSAIRELNKYGKGEEYIVK